MSSNQSPQSPIHDIPNPPIISGPDSSVSRPRSRQIIRSRSRRISIEFPDETLSIHSNSVISGNDDVGGGSPRTSVSPPPLPAVDAPPAVGDDPMEAEVPPPPYDNELRVIPMTSEQSSRYDRGALPEKSQPRHLEVPIALFTLTSPPNTVPVPAGWIEFVHPEGLKYYYNPSRRIITDSNIKKPAVLTTLIRAQAILDTRINQLRIELSNTTEVTFEVDIEQRPPVVKYYYVDHAQKSQFWLEKMTTESLGCPPVTSYTHLKYLFRQHYWTHIEYYPMHLQLSVEIEEELIAVLTHSCVDFMTSTLSTVPYNQEQCEAYLRLIKDLPNSDRAEGYRNCVLARIWSEIDGNFFVNLRGEDNPRLSRIQRLLPEPEVQTVSLVNFFKDWVMLGSSKFYEGILNDMWVDKISYSSHWRKFMTNMVNEWKMQALWTFVLLIIASITFALSISNVTIKESWTSYITQIGGLVSIIFAMVGLGSSFILLKMHRTQTEASAPEAGDYLDQFFNKHLGMQPLSLIYAVPQASSIWSFTLLAGTILTYTINLDSIISRIFVGFFIISISVGIWFLLTWLNGSNDDVESAMKKARNLITGKMRNLGRLSSRLSSQVGRRIVSVRERIQNRNNDNSNSSNANNQNESEMASTAEGAESTNLQNPTTTVVDVIPAVSASATSIPASTSSFTRQSDPLMPYVPRRTTASQNLASTINYITSTIDSGIRSAVHRLMNIPDERHTHRYQRLETIDSPINSVFRNSAPYPNQSRGSMDLERQNAFGRIREGSRSNESISSNGR